MSDVGGASLGLSPFDRTAAFGTAQAQLLPRLASGLPLSLTEPKPSIGQSHLIQPIGPFSGPWPRAPRPPPHQPTCACGTSAGTRWRSSRRSRAGRLPAAGMLVRTRSSSTRTSRNRSSSSSSSSSRRGRRRLPWPPPMLRTPHRRRCRPRAPTGRRRTSGAH